MTVAAIIEQAQNRWMEHPLMYNRGLQFQGSYCKYYLLLFIVYITINFDFSLDVALFMFLYKNWNLFNGKIWAFFVKKRGKHWFTSSSSSSNVLIDYKRGIVVFINFLQQ